VDVSGGAVLASLIVAASIFDATSRCDASVDPP
jgi:hypothetical protein